MNQSTLRQTAEGHLEYKRGSLLAKRDRLLGEFTDAARTGKSAKMQRLCRDLRQTNEFLDSLHRIEAERQKSADHPGGHRYVVSSMFLYQCFKDLTAYKDEQFFFITGSEVGGKFVLDQKAEFQHSKRYRLDVACNLS